MQVKFYDLNSYQKTFNDVKFAHKAENQTLELMMKRKQKR